MKLTFTIAMTLMGFVITSNAATVDDLEVLKHDYVLVCDALGARPGKGVLFGDNHFLDVYGGHFHTNKGTVDLSVADGNEGYITQDIVNKYSADYGGPHYNCLRLKNFQDVIAMKLIAGTKLTIFVQGNNTIGTEARIPKISKNADMSNPLNEAPGMNHPAIVSGFRWEYTVVDDGLYYIGSYNGDMFVSFIIVEVNSIEKLATPTITFSDNGLSFECETEGAEFVYDIQENSQSLIGKNVKVNPTITVSVYTKKDGFANSDTATKEIELTGLKGDINGDGKVDATDITLLIKKLIIKKQN